MEVVEMIIFLIIYEVLYHSCIKINKEKIIYIDPYHIDKNYNDADIIFITHDHYDHYSEDDIDKVRKFILFLLFLMIYYLNYLKKE